MAQRAASIALFAPFPGTSGPPSILADSLEGVDRSLLYPAIEKLLQNQDSIARKAIGEIYGKLTDRDLVTLLPNITKAIEKLAPSNEMFGDDIRLVGLDLLARLHIREGMALCLSATDPNRWGFGKRVGRCLEYLPRYGTHAKAALPQLREMREMREQVAATNKKSDELALFDKAIAAIETSTTTPTLVSIAEFKTRADGGK